MKKETMLELELGAVIFIILAIVHVLFIQGDHIETTGYAVIENPTDVQTTVQQIARQPILNDIGNNAKLCIMVENANETYSYTLRKRGDIFNVQKTSDMCEGQESEDFIVKINGYYRLLALNQKQSINYLKTNVEKENIQFLESRYILPDGKPACDDNFKKRYCGFINKEFSKNEREKIGIKCCDDPDVEMPASTKIGDIASEWWWLIAIIIGSAAIGIGSMIILGNKSDEDKTTEKKDDNQEEVQVVIEYIMNTREQGHGDMIIRKALEQEEWPIEIIDKGFEEIRKKHMSSFDRFEKVAF